MEQQVHNIFKWGGIMMLTGGLIFWAGAFFPPYRQWMTSDVNEYLNIIHDHRLNWYIIHGLFLTGVIISLFGIQIVFTAKQITERNHLFAVLGTTSILLGAVFWILNIAFRLTVTVWAANDLNASGKLAGWFQTWMDWSNMIFAIFMVLSYFGIGCLGCAMRNFENIPIWLSRFCMLYGFIGSVLFLFRFPVFAPPLMVYLPIILTGGFMVLKLR